MASGFLAKVYGMNKLLAGALALLLSISIHAKIDISAGKEKATAVCAACHQSDGNSLNGMWPKLAGQHKDYLVTQMKAFKKGVERSDPSMTAMMAPLTTDDIENLATYFNAQKPNVGFAKKANLQQGERLYRGGDEKKQISACIACHGPKGTGNAQAGFPSLSGQHPHYVIEQLKKYKSGKRTTDLNSIMRNIALRMSEGDMKAVANYISGLH
jgi:cytochrome c553